MLLLYMIKNVQIYGERCSGTNYLEDLIATNFDINITWKYGWKHFFGFNDISNSNDTLFICIVRNPFYWMNSLYKDRHHLHNTICKDINGFLNEHIWSCKNNLLPIETENNEIMEDRHIYTNKRYKNIFELRYTKLKYLLHDLPKKVKHYIFIRYEDLKDNFEQTMNKIKNCGLIIKNNIEFPINSNKYKNKPNEKYIPKTENYIVSKEIILNHPNFDFFYELKLGYITIKDK